MLGRDFSFQIRAFRRGKIPVHVRKFRDRSRGKKNIRSLQNKLRAQKFRGVSQRIQNFACPGLIVGAELKIIKALRERNGTGRAGDFQDGQVLLRNLGFPNLQILIRQIQNRGFRKRPRGRAAAQNAVHALLQEIFRQVRVRQHVARRADNGAGAQNVAVSRLVIAKNIHKSPQSFLIKVRTFYRGRRRRFFFRWRRQQRGNGGFEFGNLLGNFFKLRLLGAGGLFRFWRRSSGRRRGNVFQRKLPVAQIAVRKKKSRNQKHPQRPNQNRPFHSSACTLLTSLIFDFNSSSIPALSVSSDKGQPRHVP